jgi:hypothetical protein
MKAVLKAFSFAQLPHIAVKTLLIPFGATLMKAASTVSTQSLVGLTPRAGRFANADWKTGEEASDKNAGEL